MVEINSESYMDCFWEYGCSDSKRCQEFGSCIARDQNKNKADLKSESNPSRALKIIMESSLDHYTPYMISIPVDDWKRAMKLV